jgi:hypothetical protein
MLVGGGGNDDDGADEGLLKRAAGGCTATETGIGRAGVRGGVE